MGTATDRRTTEYVADYLRGQILAGTFKAGERLDQDAIALALNVSRTPVRESLVRLEAEGFVEVRPYRGAVVRDIDAAWAVELIALRVHTEGLAARLGAPRLTDGDLANMKAIFDEIEALRDGPERSGKFGDLNRKFHAVLYDAADAPQLVRMIEPLQLHFERLRHHYNLVRTERPNDAVSRQHEAILQACIGRDPDLAESAIRHHILGVFQLMRDVNLQLEEADLRVLHGVLRVDERASILASIA